MKLEKRLMVGWFLVLGTAFGVVLGSGVTASAARGGGWIKDPARFHVSAHGTMSCLDCHWDIPDRERHPDPLAIGAEKKQADGSALCLDCHAAVLDDLDQKIHGRLDLGEDQEIGTCAKCHDPHETPPLTDTVPESLDPQVAPPIRCDGCHEARASLPAPGGDAAPCFSCHFSERASVLCLACHGNPALATDGVMVVAESREDLGPHEGTGCLACHQGAASAPHRNQTLGSCLNCHTPHLNQAGGDPHFGVACQACHFEGVGPAARGDKGLAGALVEPTDATIVPVHRLRDQRSKDACRRCHFPGNAFGASALVLPAKSITCLPCHVATFGVHDGFSAVGLLLFLVGMAGAFSFWWSAGGRRRPANALGWGRAVAAIKALIMDGLLQARLWKRSRSRWTVHALIFMPFMTRFLFAIATLTLTRFFPQSALGWAMADKNHPATAFFFDLTGGMVLAGAVLAVRYRWSRKGSMTAKDLPPTDWPALALLGAIMLTGFFLEALRLGMTGAPGQALFAFLGSAPALILPDGTWVQTVHGWAWYIHAAMMAAFWAYLPFSRMIHIITAPITLAWRAWGRGGHAPSMSRHDPSGEEKEIHK